MWNRKYFLRVRKYDIAAGIRIVFQLLYTENREESLQFNIFRLLHQNRFLSNSTCRHHTRTVTKSQSFVKCARPYNQWIKGMMGKKRSWGLLNLSYFLPSHQTACYILPVMRRTMEKLVTTQLVFGLILSWVFCSSMVRHQPRNRSAVEYVESVRSFVPYLSQMSNFMIISNFWWIWLSSEIWLNSTKFNLPY